LSATCPNGHVSATTDYCDQCGAPIEAAAAPTPTSTPDAASAGEEVETSASARRQPCPQCGALRTGDDRYCEGCGYDFVTVPAPAAAVPAAAPAAAVPAAQPPAASANGPAPAAAWEAVTSADRAQFDRLAPAGLEFPGDYQARRFPLTGAEVRIGRTHAPDRPPDINLVEAPEDPAVSHLHAVLERQADGSYTLRDLGSTNGTTLNDDPTPIGREVGAPVSDGDRIHIGAWTTITLRKTP
jgi:hypothetical protein